MILYKFISERQLKKFPNWIEYNGMIYTNEEAIEIAIKSKEWFELFEEEIPEYNPETEYVDYIYIQEEKRIRKHYEVKELEDL